MNPECRGLLLVLLFAVAARPLPAESQTSS